MSGNTYKWKQSQKKNSYTVIAWLRHICLHSNIVWD